MSETKWSKGDRLKITIEAEARESFSFTDDYYEGNILLKENAGHEYRCFSHINTSTIQQGGGSVTVEVLPKSVVLPTKKWAQVVLDDGGLGEVLVTRTGTDEWRTLLNDLYFDDDVVELYIRTISEGVDK